ncbi:hypothetical protein GINT2_001077 [Glugoides intestinalis]
MECDKNNCKICKIGSFIGNEWSSLLYEELEKEYFKAILKVLHNEDVFYPPAEMIFNFTKLTPFEIIKVVIIGQDPYHNSGQAMGLAFSVPESVKTPPSLVNIYRELQADIPGFIIPAHGDLTKWSQQGVLLLNNTLSVLKNQPASHSKIGWKLFTGKIIEKINTKFTNLVFILWGRHARQYAKVIDSEKHLILEAGHPSPFSVKSFRGCKHFSTANGYLKAHGKPEIDWQI